MSSPSHSSPHIYGIFAKSTFLYKMYCNLGDVCPLYTQHSIYITDKIGFHMRYCNTNTASIEGCKYSFFPCSIGVWNHLSFSALSNVMPMKKIHMAAIPAKTRSLRVLGT